jgi:hypothetical protein
MSHPQRVIAELNANLAGLYYVLVPADSKTEWTLAMQHVVKYDDVNAKTSAYNLFNQYYKTEAAIAKLRGPKYKSLMADIAGDYKDEELDRGKLEAHIDERVDNLLNYLVKTGGISKDSSGKFSWANFNTDFARANKLVNSKGKVELDEAGMRKLLRFTETNYMINNIEMHKLYFGDLADIKDPTKRYKSFMSPRESTIHADPEFNNVLNEKLNVATDTKSEVKLDPNMIEDTKTRKTVKLKPGDYGYHDHTDNIKTLTVRDQLVAERSILDDNRLHAGNPLQRAKLHSAYADVNPTDGSGMVTLVAHREIMYKRGQVTAEHDAMYNYLLANDRQEMLKDGKLQEENPDGKNYYRPELK